LRDLQTILQTCDALAVQFAATADQYDRDGSFAYENAEAMRAAGLCKITLPREYGGDGLDALGTADVLIRIAHGDASTALGLAMHVNITAQMSEGQFFTPEAIDRLFKECGERGIFVNNVASEPEMGSPSRGGLPNTTAMPVEGGYMINGRKSWVTYAPALDYLFTTVTIKAEGLEPQPAVLAVSGKSEGLELLNNWGNESIALRASGSCDVIYKDVFVPAHWLMQKRESDQVRSNRQPPGWSATAFAAVYLGVGEAALAATARYVKQRVPTALGKPIAELPHIQRNLGQMQVLLTGARAVLFEAAGRWSHDLEGRVGMDAQLATAKHLCTNAAIEATDIALRTVGANGLDRRLPLERLFRDARAGLMHPPQDEAALELIGRSTIQNEEARRLLAVGG